MRCASGTLHGRLEARAVGARLCWEMSTRVGFDGRDSAPDRMRTPNRPGGAGDGQAAIRDLPVVPFGSGEQVGQVPRGAEGFPFAFALTEAVGDREQHGRVVPEAAVAPAHLDVLPCRSLGVDADVPSHHAIGPRVDVRGRNGQRCPLVFGETARPADMGTNRRASRLARKVALLRSPSRRRNGLPSVITWRTASGWRRASSRA